MSNIEKFKEVFGFEPNTNSCIIPENQAECVLCDNVECDKCKYENWWECEYKENI